MSITQKNKGNFSFDQYAAIEIATYFSSLWRWTHLMDTPSNTYIYTMVFLANGLVLRQSGKPLIAEDLIYDGDNNILIPTLLDLVSKKSHMTLQFKDFNNHYSCYPSDFFLFEFLMRMMDYHCRYKDEEFVRILCQPNMPLAKCKELGLVSGDKVIPNILMQCFN